MQFDRVCKEVRCGIAFIFMNPQIVITKMGKAHTDSSTYIKISGCDFQNDKKILGFFFLRFYLFIFRERGRRERGREASMRKRYIDQLPLALAQVGTWSATQACALTGNRTGNPLVFRRALNPLSHTSQAGFLSFTKD